MSTKKLKIEEIDPNFKVEAEIGESDVVFYDVMDEPFEKYGFYNCCREEGYKRLPDDIGKNVNAGVAALYLNTAGGRVRFSTDSKYIAIRAHYPNGLSSHSILSVAASAGFDLFIDDPETEDSRFCKARFYPSRHDQTELSCKVVFETRKTRYFTLYFPSYNDVGSVFIGLQNDATLDRGMPYRNREPIVFYGNSITQGACASRSGNAYTNTVSRRLNMDILNLGFSGSGRGEDLIVDYMAELPMSVFVCDYDHNAPSVEHLRKTHLKLYQKIREKNPDIPFIILSKPDYNFSINNAANNSARRDVIYETYRYAINQGDKNVYFVDGEGYFRGPNEDMCTVDGTHPNDLGMALMADSVTETIRRIMIYQNF